MTFAGVGIWLGRRITGRRHTVEVREVLVPAPVEFVRDQDKVAALGITRRELEPLPVALVFTLVTAGVVSRKHTAPQK